MNNWQKFISKHNSDIDIISNKQIRVNNAAYNPSNNQYYYDIVTAQENGFLAETFFENENKKIKKIESVHFNSIREYLGY